jgi:dual specificity protein kinase YAK1
MIESGKQAGHFFEACYDQYGAKSYRLKSIDQYSRERNVQEQPSKKYFTATTLPDIIKTYPMPRKGSKPVDADKGARALTYRGVVA